MKAANVPDVRTKVLKLMNSKFFGQHKFNNSFSKAASSLVPFACLILLETTETIIHIHDVTNAVFLFFFLQ